MFNDTFLPVTQKILFCWDTILSYYNLSSVCLGESQGGTPFPDRGGVYLQCHAVYTAATLHPMQCVPAVYVYTAATLELYCLYTPLRSGLAGR